MYFFYNQLIQTKIKIFVAGAAAAYAFPTKEASKA